MKPRVPSLLVGSQIPEHISTDYPKFVQFLEAYYDFLQSYNNRIEKLRDVTQTADEFVSFLRNEFVSRYPQALIDDRKLIMIIRNLYRSKGTLGAVELLFRIFFNEAIIIQQPGKNILRASDGRWNQEYSITVERKYGEIDFSSPITLRVKNLSGEFFVEVERFEIIDPTNTRFYFKITSNVVFDSSQYIDIVGDDGKITYRGSLVKSPSRLRIDKPGKNWKLGQVILIKSAFNELSPASVARVTGVGENGELSNLEIISYGFDHTDGQTILANPYPVPSTASWDLISTPTGVTLDGKVIYNHQLSLTSYVDRVSEVIEGISTTASSQNSYFLENYGQDDYNAKVVLTQLIETVATSSRPTVNTDVTLEEWLESRTTLVYEFDYVVIYRGSFNDDRGRLSNTNMRLQDNYFYQMFSYVIETSLNISQYRNALNMIHPAGLKFFGELAKTAVIFSNTHEVIRTLSRETIYLNDSSDIDDLVFNHTTKNLQDNNSIPTDLITSFNVGKNVLTYQVIDDDISSFSVTKARSDEATVVESLVAQVLKALSHTSIANDSSIDKLIGKELTNVASSSELVAFSSTKALSHESAVNDGSASINTETIIFTEEDYSGEAYVSAEIILTIG